MESIGDISRYEALEKLLDQYIDGKQYGAFFIDGKWGSGKTFFIKEYINKRDFVGTYTEKIGETKKELSKLNKQIEIQKELQSSSSNKEIEKNIEKITNDIKEKKGQLEKLQEEQKSVQESLEAIKDKTKSGAIDPNHDIRNTQFYYISLNGISKADDIARLIFSEISIHVKQGLEKSVVKTIENALSAISIHTAVNGVSVSFCIQDILKNINYYDYIKDNAITKMVLVFDDIERCKIEISEVLGFINRFIEEKACKVIIIGNEEEMEKSIYSSERTTQLLGATILAAADKKNDELDSSNANEPQEALLKDNKQNEDETKLTSKDNSYDLISIKRINDNMKAIASNFSIFSEIKEKFISYTHHFKTDYEYVIKEMTKGIEAREQGIDKRMAKYVVALEIENMRILSIALDKISAIYKELKRSDLQNISNEEVKNIEFGILLATYCMYVIPTHDIAKNFNEFFYDTSSFPNFIKEYSKYEQNARLFVKAGEVLKDFKYIDAIFDYVYYDKLEPVFEEVKNQKKATPVDLENIYAYWDTQFESAEELTNSFKRVLESFETLDIEDMLKVYYKYGEYRYKYKFQNISGHTLDMKYKVICEEIKKNPKPLSKLDFYIISSREEMSDKFKAIKNLVNSETAGKTFNQLVGDIANKNKQMDFNKYSQAARKNRGFFSYYGIKKLKKMVKEFTIPEITRFNLVCQNVYWGDDIHFVFKSDSKDIELLVKFLETEISHKRLDKLRKGNLTALKEQLNYILSQLK